MGVSDILTLFLPNVLGAVFAAHVGFAVTAIYSIAFEAVK